MTNNEMVREFMLAVGQVIQSVPNAAVSRTLADLRVDLIEEEFNELTDSVLTEDIVGVADALGDLLYVIYGMGWAYGIDLDAVFAEIHRSNMSKLENGKPVFRPDGKVLKGPNYSAPDIRLALGVQ